MLTNLNSTLTQNKTSHNELLNKLDYIKNQNSQLINSPPLKDDLSTLLTLTKGKQKDSTIELKDLIEKLSDQVKLNNTILEKELEEIKNFLLDIKKITLS